MTRREPPPPEVAGGSRWHEEEEGEEEDEPEEERRYYVEEEVEVHRKGKCKVAGQSRSRSAGAAPIHWCGPRLPPCVTRRHRRTYQPVRWPTLRYVPDVQGQRPYNFVRFAPGPSGLPDISQCCPMRYDNGDYTPHGVAMLLYGITSRLYAFLQALRHSRLFHVNPALALPISNIPVLLDELFAQEHRLRPYKRWLYPPLRYLRRQLPSEPSLIPEWLQDNQDLVRDWIMGEDGVAHIAGAELNIVPEEFVNPYRWFGTPFLAPAMPRTYRAPPQPVGGTAIEPGSRAQIQYSRHSFWPIPNPCPASTHTQHLDVNVEDPAGYTHWFRRRCISLAAELSMLVHALQRTVADAERATTDYTRPLRRLCTEVDWWYHRHMPPPLLPFLYVLHAPLTLLYGVFHESGRKDARPYADITVWITKQARLLEQLAAEFLYLAARGPDYQAALDIASGWGRGALVVLRDDELPPYYPPTSALPTWQQFMPYAQAPPVAP